MKAHQRTKGYLYASILFFAMALLIGLLGYSSGAFGQANHVSAAWDANTEPDLAGYRIYWSQEQGLYGDAFEVPVGSFVPKPGVNQIQTGWLVPGPWYFVATALDTAGNESGFSNESMAIIPDTAPGAPQTINFQVTLPDGTVIDLSVVTP